MAILEDAFNMAINALRGEIGSFGEILFECYAGQFKVDFDATAEGLEGLKVRPGTRVMTFSNFNRRTRARYARHQLINRTSVLEKVGDEPDQITLDIKLIKDLGVTPEEEIERIRTYIKDGHEDSLIIGSEVLGEFVVTELAEGRLFVDCFGRTLVAELNLTFEEAGAAEQTETATSTDLPLIWL
ncbi:MAG: phage tail protein [Selenomonadaceae bacterium]|nr:phage tail protein [Selenomonadaceae bacterium]